MDFKDFLIKMVALKASDLFVTVDRSLCVKVNQNLLNLTVEKLTPEQTKAIAFNLMTEAQRLEFLEKKEANFAIYQPGLGRFRVNVFMQRNNVGIVLRRIETKIPTVEALNLPSHVAKFALLKRGLILIVGAAGAGKSSTLAALLGYRNNNAAGHIIIIEDPIEFIHEHNKSIITQREVGLDTESFGVALQNTLRQSPDVIVLGEIRSEEVMSYALSFAESGHLCIATLHANNANSALERIINFFPDNKHHQVWADLSLNLRAIVAQQLLPLADNSGSIPAVEVLVNSPVVADNIKKGEVHILRDYMTKGSEQGMQTFDQALFKLYQDGKIDYDKALLHADSANELRLMIKLQHGGNLDNASDGLELQDM